MAWDDTKQTNQVQSDVPADEQITSSEWNTHVDDQKARGYNTIASVTSDYTASVQELVLVDASSSPVTVTLPTATEVAVVTIKVTDASNDVTIATPQSETIDGSNSLTISSQYVAREIASDGTDYYII
jgi:hypothetical protein